jgi:hypothetical protein
MYGAIICLSRVVSYEWGGAAPACPPPSALVYLLGLLTRARAATSTCQGELLRVISPALRADPLAA